MQLVVFAQTSTATLTQPPIDQTTGAMGSLLLVLAVLLLSGAFGGFIHGIMSPSDNIIKLFSKTGTSPSVALGIWGDVFTGAAASLALMFLGKALFDFRLDDLLNDKPQLEVILRIVAVGVIAGVSGGALLNNLAAKLGKLAADVSSVETKIQIESRRGPMLREAGVLMAKDAFAEAEAVYGRILAEFGPTAEVLTGIGTAKSYLAAPDGANPATFNVTELNNALRLFKDALQQDIKYEKAWYNTAANKAALLRHAKAKGIAPPFTIDNIAEDLKQAIALEPTNKAFIRTDQDFADILADPVIVKILT
ncbi:hypothetical protein PHYC_01737 [Phycisphaerales bacterium]|nr:hypothetical protein PHYC_01737 [Phycisphaerales bacterium]